MAKFKLICDHSCDLDTHVVTHEFNAEYLPDVIQNIDMFLKGAGYIYNGELDIIDPAELNFGVQHNEHFFDTGRNR